MSTQRRCVALLKLVSIIAGFLVLSFAGAQGDSVPLEGTVWQLVSFGGAELRPPLEGTEISLVFSTDEAAKVSGSAGCNRYFGPYEVQGESLSVPQLSSTRKLCRSPAGVMRQEQRYSRALTSATTYHIEGNRLEIRYGVKDGGALRFVAQHEVSGNPP